MREPSAKIIEKARELVSQNRVIKDVDSEKRIHFKVLGDTEEHIVTYNKLKDIYDCDCSFFTLRHKTCSHITACILHTKTF